MNEVVFWPKENNTNLLYCSYVAGRWGYYWKKGLGMNMNSNSNKNSDIIPLGHFNVDWKFFFWNWANIFFFVH